MRVLFLNHKQRQCGVYQYGKRTYNLLKQSLLIDFYYEEVENEDEYVTAVKNLTPNAIIYNYHNLTMAWLGKQHTSLFPLMTHFGIHHEGSIPYHIGFNYQLHANSTFVNTKTEMALPRPLLEYNKPSKENDIPIIGSFGFGFGHKGFGSIIKLVNDQFERADIKLHIPRAYYGDNDGSATAGVVPGCWNEMYNKNVTLSISHGFLSEDELLNFLSDNTLNVFLYHETGNVGLSSVIDYALSVDTPIAVNKTSMFRHINRAVPSICVEDKTLPEIIKEGVIPLLPLKKQFSISNFVDTFEHILLNNTR